VAGLAALASISGAEATPDFGGVVGLNAQTGKVLWRGTTSGETLASPSEAAGMLFTPDGSSIDAWSP
jgi:PQQ enzyme repeat